MAVVALASLVAFGLCIGARGWLHTRRTGSSPFRAGAANGKLAVAGYAVLFSVPALLDATNVLPRLMTVAWAGPTGIGAVAAGCIGCLWSAVTMGASWRIGVDDNERTQLVTTGVYRIIRNPIYSAMVLFAAGMALITPNIAAIAAVIIIVAVLEFVVRTVEEPYLTRTHGQRYTDWASRSGRFLPGLGKLHTQLR